MAFETLKQYRRIEFDMDAVAASRLRVFTELPGQTMRERHSAAFEATVGRVPIKMPLPGTTKGQQIKLRVESAGVVRLYGCRVFARVLGSASGWGWYPVPVEPTPDVFAEAHLPIEPTPEGFGEARLPIEETPEAFAEARLPIDPTPEDFSAGPLLMRESPLDRTWVALPVDESE